MAILLGIVLNLAFMGFLVYAIMGIFRKSSRKQHFKTGGLGMLACFIGFAVLTPFLPDDMVPEDNQSSQTASDTPSQVINDVKPPEYSIRLDEKLAPHKRTVEIVLNRRVSENELAAIAKKVKAKDRKRYERTFISYDLKNTTQDMIGMSYAVSHYNPDLEINFLGLSSDEEAIVWDNVNALDNDTIEGDIVGTWVNYGFPGSVIVIEKRADDYYFHTVYPKPADEKRGPITEKVKVIADGNNKRFYMPCCDGEWYRLNPKGELRFQSDLGSDRVLPKAIRR